MDERKPPRGKDDDLPIIGDYSAAADRRLRAEQPAAPRPPPEPSPKPASGAARPTGSEQWRPDPSDVRRYARLAQQRAGNGPLGRVWRYGAAALALAAIFAVYWNFETLRAVTIDFPVLANLFADDAGVDGGATRPSGGEPETVAVEASGVVGTAAPTSIGGDPPPAAEDEVAAAAPAAEPASAAPSIAPVAAPEPPAPPEPPPGPETYAFGLSVVNVSEADASAAIVVLRSGGRRAPASITWWTTDETATAGVDYARLGVGVERFAAGEQNRTLHVPIVGDRNVEGPETFYVSIAAGDKADTTAEPLQKLLVVINDDD